MTAAAAAAAGAAAGAAAAAAAAADAAGLVKQGVRCRFLFLVLRDHV